MIWAYACGAICLAPAPIGMTMVQGSAALCATECMSWAAMTGLADILAMWVSGATMRCPSPMALSGRKITQCGVRSMYRLSLMTVHTWHPCGSSITSSLPCSSSGSDGACCRSRRKCPSTRCQSTSHS